MRPTLSSGAFVGIGVGAVAYQRARINDDWRSWTGCLLIVPTLWALLPIKTSLKPERLSAYGNLVNRQIGKPIPVKYDL